MMLHQQSTLDKLHKGELLASSNLIDTTLIGRIDHDSSLLLHQSARSEPNSATSLSRTRNIIPWKFLFEREGVSAQLVSLPNGEGTFYRATLHISLFSKMYSTRLTFSPSFFNFDRMLHVHNIVSNDAPIIMACQVGDFDAVRSILRDGAARGSDVTPQGYPILEVSQVINDHGNERLISINSMPLRVVLQDLFDCFSNTVLILH